MSRVQMTSEQFDFMQRRLDPNHPLARRRVSDLKTPSIAKPFDKRAHDRKPENIVDRQISDFLKHTGWIVSRNHVGLFVPYRVAKSIPLIINGWDMIRINEKGIPDRKAERIIPGRPGVVERFWYEVKRSGAKPSPEQREWIRRHKALGELAEYFDAFDDEFDDGHSALPWVERHFGRSPGDPAGFGL